MDSTMNTSSLPVGQYSVNLTACTGYTTTIANATTKDLTPRAYRLRKTALGEYVLQGGFAHSKQWGTSWIEWEDLETLNE